MINYLKTTVLLAAMTALLVFMGIGLVGPERMWLALGFALGINAYVYRQGRDWHLLPMAQQSSIAAPLPTS